MRAGGALFIAAFLALAFAFGPAGEPGPPASVPAPQYFPPLECPPLEPPLRLSGSFGEYRSGHFHAGLDFSTDEAVGRPVYASLSGRVTRVRASGVGYGRSVYVQAGDGRLLVYGHLDAFDEPLASYVAAVQDSSSQYEQDLWPDSARFRVHAGQRLGWSGRSGTDAPHLHFEIRRGDVAYNPLLAGVTVADDVAPVFRRVTVESVRSRADTARAGEPRTLTCTGNDTALVAGAVRLIVEAVDARADGRFTLAPWRVALERDGVEVECRFDSVSWAEGMTEVDCVYDRGRVMPQGRRAIMLWAPPGFRPRVLRARVPAPEAAGTVAVEGGRRSAGVRLVVQDVAGHTAVETLVLRPGPTGETGRGTPGGSWVAAESYSTGGLAGFAWSMAPGTLFETSRLAVADLGRARATGELRPCSHVFALTPVLTPLRKPMRVSIAAGGPGTEAQARCGPAGAAAAPPVVALYRDVGGGWEYLGAGLERRGEWIGAETRALGRFALLRDGAAPRIHLKRPPRRPPAGPYPRWALEALVEEEGSGVDARSSCFVVDGRRVPSEWDAVANTLRWRPLRTPAGGPHDVEIVLTDRAGNVRRREAGFVLD